MSTAIPQPRLRSCLTRLCGVVLRLLLLLLLALALALGYYQLAGGGRSVPLFQTSSDPNDELVIGGMYLGAEIDERGRVASYGSDDFDMHVAPDLSFRITAGGTSATVVAGVVTVVADDSDPPNPIFDAARAMRSPGQLKTQQLMPADVELTSELVPLRMKCVFSVRAWMHRDAPTNGQYEAPTATNVKETSTTNTSLAARPLRVHTWLLSCRMRTPLAPNPARPSTFRATGATDRAYYFVRLADLSDERTARHAQKEAERAALEAELEVAENGWLPARLLSDDSDGGSGGTGAGDSLNKTALREEEAEIDAAIAYLGPPDEDVEVDDAWLAGWAQGGHQPQHMGQQQQQQTGTAVTAQALEVDALTAASLHRRVSLRRVWGGGQRGQRRQRMLQQHGNSTAAIAGSQQWDGTAPDDFCTLRLRAVPNGAGRHNDLKCSVPVAVPICTTEWATAVALGGGDVGGSGSSGSDSSKTAPPKVLDLIYEAAAAALGLPPPYGGRAARRARAYEAGLDAAWAAVDLLERAIQEGREGGRDAAWAMEQLPEARAAAEAAAAAARELRQAASPGSLWLMPRGQRLSNANWRTLLSGESGEGESGDGGVVTGVYEPLVMVVSSRDAFFWPGVRVGYERELHDGFDGPSGPRSHEARGEEGGADDLGVLRLVTRAMRPRVLSLPQLLTVAERLDIVDAAAVAEGRVSWVGGSEGTTGSKVGCFRSTCYPPPFLLSRVWIPHLPAGRRLPYMPLLRWTP